MQHGELVQWNDARGFGFILARDGKRYFVHISNIGRIATRPREGDLVTFAPGKSRDGRLEARSVFIDGANPKASARQLRRGTETPTSLSWRSPLAGVFVVLIAVGLLLDHLPWLVAGLYAPCGLVSFFAYARDKQAAEQRQWRTSEIALLGVDLAFGIIGGLLGQDIFRHKTRKPGYVATTLLIAGVHLLWLGGFATGFITADTVRALHADLMALIG